MPTPEPDCLEPLQELLALNRSCSFLFDLQANPLHKSLSFITAQDMKEEQRSPAPACLGRPSVWLDEGVGAEAEEEWGLSPEQRRLTSYECLLLCHGAHYLHALQRAAAASPSTSNAEAKTAAQGSNAAPKRDAAADAIWTMQRRLGIPETRAAPLLRRLTAALASPDCPAALTSWQFRQHLLWCAARERQSGRVPSPPAAENGDPRDGETSCGASEIPAEVPADAGETEGRHTTVLAHCCLLPLAAPPEPGLAAPGSPGRAAPDSVTPIILFMGHDDPDAGQSPSSGGRVAVSHLVAQVRTQLRQVKATAIRHTLKPSADTEARLRAALDALDREVAAARYARRRSSVFGSHPQPIPRPPSHPLRTQSPCRAGLMSPLCSPPPQPPASSPPTLQLPPHLQPPPKGPESPMTPGSSNGGGPQHAFSRHGSGGPPERSHGLHEATTSAWVEGSGPTEGPGAGSDYLYPLNAHLYMELLHTFFVDLEEDVARLEGQRKPKLPQHLQLWRTRSQEARLREVVDMTAAFRAEFHISNFLHACCFAYVIFCRFLAGLVNEEEMHRLLSVDCYFFPGFQSLCEAGGLAPEEERQRQDVLQPMGSEFITRLADYHCEFPSSPGDILFILRLYVMLSSPRTGAGSGSLSTTPSLTKVDAAEDLLGASVPSIVPLIVEERPAEEAGRLDREAVAAALKGLGRTFGPDVLEVVAECMEHGGLAEAKAVSTTLSIPVYMELLCALVSSAYRHYLRVKAKVVHVMHDLRDSNDLFRLCPLFCDDASTSPRRALHVVQRGSGPGRAGRGGGPLKPQPSYSEQCAGTVLSVPQLLNLVEVMLFELHSECQNFLPCFTGVIPSAVTYSVNHYLRLLAADVCATLQSVSQQVEGLPGDHVGNSSWPRGDSQDVTPFMTDSPASRTPQRRTSILNFESPFSFLSGAVDPADPNAVAGQTQSLLSPQPPPAELEVLRLSDLPNRDGLGLTEGMLSPMGLTSHPDFAPRLSILVHTSGSLPSSPANLGHLVGGTGMLASDVVALTLLNADYVYLTLLLALLQANCTTYLSFPAPGFTWDRPVAAPQSGPTTPRSQLNRWTGWVQKEREKSRWGRTSTSSAPRSVPEEGAAGQEGHASDHLARSTSWNPADPTSGSSQRLTTILLSSCASGSSEAFRTEAQRAKSFVAERMAEVIDDTLAQWKALVNRLSERCLWRMMEEEENESIAIVDASPKREGPGGTAEAPEVEAAAPSGPAAPAPPVASAEGLVGLLRRTVAVVRHGVDNAFEAFRKGFPTTTLSPLPSPAVGDDQSLLPEFLAATAPSLKMFRGLCAELSSNLYALYCDRLARPMRHIAEPTCQQTIAAVDDAVLARYPLPRLAAMVNSVLYCQERIRGLQGAAAGFMCPGTPVQHPPNHSVIAPPMLSDEALAAGAASLAALRFLFAYQLVGRSGRQQLQRLYAGRSDPHRMAGVLAALRPTMGASLPLVLPPAGGDVAHAVLRQLAHGMFCVVAKGKLKSTDTSALFVKVLEDIEVLWNFFTAPQDVALMSPVSAEVAQPPLNDVLVAATALLCRNPAPDAAVCLQLTGRGDRGFCLSRYTVLSLQELFPAFRDVQVVLTRYLRWLTKVALQERDERRCREVDQGSCVSEFTVEKEMSVGESDAENRDKSRKISRMCAVM